MGGFLEDLRKQMAAEDQAQLIARQNAEKERVASLESARERQLQKEKERRLREDSWRIAKAHFEQTGVRGMFNRIISLKAAMSMSEDKDNKEKDYDVKRRKWIDSEDKPPKENFTVWLSISKTESESSFIRIVTSADGTLTFHGASAISVPKEKWESNKGILEEVLGRVYKQPRIYHSESSSRRSYEDFMNGSSRG